MTYLWWLNGILYPILIKYDCKHMIYLYNSYHMIYFYNFIHMIYLYTIVTICYGLCNCNLITLLSHDMIYVIIMFGILCSIVIMWYVIIHIIQMIYYNDLQSWGLVYSMDTCYTPNHYDNVIFHCCLLKYLVKLSSHDELHVIFQMYHMICSIHLWL